MHLINARNTEHNKLIQYMSGSTLTLERTVHFVGPVFFVLFTTRTSVVVSAVLFKFQNQCVRVS